MKVIGHRGDGRGPDENTRASWRRALEHGADVIELDVQLVGGELMLAHPPRQPKESLAAALRDIDRPLVLHLKRRRLNPWHDRAVLGRLQKVNHRPGIIVSSFWPGTLRYAKRQYPKLRTAFITRWLGWDRRFADSLGVDELHAWSRTLTQRAVRRTPRPVIAVVANTATDRLCSLGLAGVITDRVSAFARNPISAGTRRRTRRATSTRPRSR